MYSIYNNNKQRKQKKRTNDFSEGELGNFLWSFLQVFLVKSLKIPNGKSTLHEFNIEMELDKQKNYSTMMLYVVARQFIAKEEK